MTAKEYLNQVRKLKRQTDSKMRQCEDIREKITFLQGIDYEKDKIQSSVSDQLAETMAVLLDLEQETVWYINKYNIMYNEAVNRINGLSRKEYIDILMQRYLGDDDDKRKFEYIAYKTNYSYNRIRHMHGEALQEFERKYLR